MNILVTGGSGFIGTRLVDKLLEQNHKVKIYDKVQSIKYPRLSVIADVRDEEKLIGECQGVDVIYNLAAEHADDVTPKSLYSDVNIGGAKNVVLAAQKNNIKKIIFISSVAIYGLNRKLPMENDIAQPFNEYGRTKYEAERIFLAWSDKCSDSSLIIIRPSVIFGENNRGNVYNLISQIIGGNFFMVGDGKNRKSMGYVGNIAAFLSTQLKENTGIFIFNYADKPDLSSIEIVEIVKNEMGLKKKIVTIPYFAGLLGGSVFDIVSRVTGKKFPISSIRIKKFCAETTIDTNLLIKSGFRAPFTLEEGLRKMIRTDFKTDI